MRKIALSLVAIGVLFLIVAWYPHYVDKPVKDGNGPLSIYVDPGLSAPEYHSPLDWWQLHHGDILNRGDLVQSDCLECHDPEKSCNHCHRYVGVADIVP
ncbi:MAG: hypothetical protein M1282_13395 [Chloroflexi bacterium]|nr:hypothetical protein [Chloroflexota bacterium]